MQSSSESDIKLLRVFYAVASLLIYCGRTRVAYATGSIGVLKNWKNGWIWCYVIAAVVAFK